MEKQPNQFNYGIQYLRGLAALAVLLCHYGSGIKVHPSFANVINFGKFGVHVFFLISGYVITLSLLSNHYHPRYFFKFLLKRSVRIEPAYIVTILLTLLSFWLFSLFPSFKGETMPFIPAQFFAHVFYLVPFTKWDFYNTIFWTLGVEFQFYLLMGCLYFLSQQLWFRVVFLVLLVLSTFIPLENGEYLLFNYGAIFALGIAAMHFEATRDKLYLLAMIIAAIAICIHDGLPILILLSCSLLVIFYFRHQIQMLNFLGKISYSLYIIHPLVLIYVNGLTKKLVPIWRSYELFLFCVQVAAAIAVAYVFYCLIERPSIALSKKIVYQHS